MKKNVVGVFASSFEALRTIDSMKNDGIDKSHIHVIAHDDYETRMIEEKAGVAVDQQLHSDEERTGFWEELKAFFTGTDSEHNRFQDYLINIGMNEYDVEQYAVEVDGGKILVLVDSDYDTGRTGVISGDNPAIQDHASQMDEDSIMATDQNSDMLEYNVDTSNGQNGDEAVSDESLNSYSLVENKDRKIREKEYEEEENPFYQSKQDDYDEIENQDR